MEENRVFCLMGPTAVGKTDLAIQLAEQLPVQIISVDSAMVYRGMNIGTAKPSREQLIKTPHRLIDICDPAHHYSAGQFCQDARREIESIIAAGKIPLLVGGTMLYFHLLQRGFGEFPGADPEIRQNIKKQADELGWPALHKKLELIDPKMAKQLHPNDAQRIHRALEIYESTGKTMSEWQEQQIFESPTYQWKNIIIAPSDRSLLHQRIADRFDQMLKQGLIDEVKHFYERGDLSLATPAMRTVGYRQVWQYLSGEWDEKTLREKAIIATRQLAKRQLTWLRSWKQAYWFESEQPDLLRLIVKSDVALIEQREIKEN